MKLIRFPKGCTHDNERTTAAVASDSGFWSSLGIDFCLLLLRTALGIHDLP
jgi:hypothetical protein